MMKKTRMIPPLLMLVAGAITSIITYVYNYEIKVMLFTLLFVLIVFYILGVVVKRILDSLAAQLEKSLKEEGEVIEKQVEEENQE